MTTSPAEDTRSPFVREMDAAFARFIGARTAVERAAAREGMAEVMRRHLAARKQEQAETAPLPLVDRKAAAAGKDE